MAVLQNLESSLRKCKLTLTKQKKAIERNIHTDQKSLKKLQAYVGYTYQDKLLPYLD